MRRVRIGLDVGASKIHGIAVPFEAGVPGGVLADVLAEVHRPVERGPDGVVDSVLSVVSALRSSLGPGVTVASVGVGVPGAVNADGVVQNAVNLGIAGPVNLRDELGEALGVPVAVDNDVNVATLGAVDWVRGHGGVPDLVLLSVGTGLAAGLALDGVPRRDGWRGNVGEVGHLPVVSDGPRCACGQRGCLELYASGSGLARQWPYAGPGPQPIALFRAAAEGDPAAVEVRESFLGWLAHAVRLLVLVTDARHVVLGGGVTRLGSALEAPLRRRLAAANEHSAFAAGLRLGERVVMLPPQHQTAALGAVALSSGATVDEAPDGDVSASPRADLVG